MWFQGFATVIVIFIAIYVAYRLSGASSYVKIVDDSEPEEKSKLELTILLLEEKKKELSNLAQTIKVKGKLYDINKQLDLLTKKLDKLETKGGSKHELQR